MNYRKEYEARVARKVMLNADTAYLTLECPDIAANARPGQFVNISCSYFLKRPFGIASVDRAAGTFSVGIKIVGKGTADLAGIAEGEVLNVLGPLGNGFDLDGFDSYILVSGGTGVFPVNFAYEELAASSKTVTVVQGFRDSSQIVMNRPEYVLTTDAGDAGIHGNCCNGLDSLEDIADNTAVLCVGPLPMMKAVGSWAQSRGLKCFVSMEQRMACGIGICLVCVCKVKSEQEGVPFDHVRCCKDGPVFPYEEVVW